MDAIETTREATPYNPNREATQGITNEAEALASILTWSSESPEWQQDALRRLVERNALDVTEIDELVAICKGESAAIPLEAVHLRDPNRDHGRSICGKCTAYATSTLWLPTNG